MSFNWFKFFQFLLLLLFPRSKKSPELDENRRNFDPFLNEKDDSVLNLLDERVCLGVILMFEFSSLSELIRYSIMAPNE